MEDLKKTALRMVQIREGVRANSPRSTELARSVVEEEPTAAILAQLAWEFIEDVLAEAAPSYKLPPPASESELVALRVALVSRFSHEPPKMLAALLARHDGILRGDAGTAFFSVEQILNAAAWLEDVDPTLLPISADLAGNCAVMRLSGPAEDFGQVYGFWHEDFADRGLEPLAGSIGEYLMLARHQIIETITDMYHGPML